MTFDDLKNKWHKQEHGKLIISEDILLKEVRRNKKSFELLIFWRDVREGGVSFLLAGFFGYQAIKMNVWSLYITAISVLFVGIYLVADRMIQKKKICQREKNLNEYIQISLTQVEHQIWLLKNVFWWYLLPVLFGVAIFFAHVAWNLRSSGRVFWEHIFRSAGILIVVNWGVYKLNQYAAKKALEPRKDELEQLLSQFKDSNQ